MKKLFLWLLILMLALSFASVASAQPTAPIFFLARADSDGNGFVDDDDAITLFVGDTSGSSTQLSEEDADVITYGVNAERSIAAYLANTVGGSVLDVVRLGDLASQRLAIADLNPIQTAIFGSTVWVVGRTSTDVPVVRGYDINTLAQTAERVFRSAGTVISFSVDGNYVMGYNASSGGLGVFTLPNFGEPLPLGFQGYALTPPAWSPSEAKFALVIGDINNVNDARLAVQDAASGTTVVIDLPEDSGVNSYSFAWSSAGDYITTSSRSAGSPAAVNALIDISSGFRIPLEPAGTSVIGWSADDQWVGLVNYAGASATLQIAAVPSLQTRAIAALLVLNVQTMVWSRNGTQFVALGTSADGRTQLLLANAASGDSRVLADRADALFTQTLPFWSADGDYLYYVAPSGDALISTEVPQALYALQIGTGEVARVSPDGYSVVPILITP